MNTFRKLTEPETKEEETEVTAPFHEPREEEEIRAAQDGISTGSREEGPSQQES